jgi:hypothetical protein
MATNAASAPNAAQSGASVAEVPADKPVAGKFGGNTVLWAGLIVLGCGGVVASLVVMFGRKHRRKAAGVKWHVARPAATTESAPASGSEVIGSTRENIGSREAEAGAKPAAAPKSNGRHRHGTRRRKTVDYTRFFMDLRSTVSDNSAYMEPEIPAGYSLQPDAMAWPEMPAPAARAPSLSAAASANSEMIAQQKHLIEEQQRLIQEQTKLIEEKTRLLAEKSALLARQAELIDERLLPS